MQQEDFAAQHSSRIFTWNYNAFHNCFIKVRYEPDNGKHHRLNLKNQEDLKALVWAYGGPRPSLITKVEVKVIPERFVVEVHWKDTIPNEDTNVKGQESKKAP